MGLHSSIIMIDGDQRSQIGAIFECFEYRRTGLTEHCQSIGEADKLMEWTRRGKPQSIVYKAVCIADGWTVIFDPRLQRPPRRRRPDATSQETRLEAMVRPPSSGTAL